MARLLLLTLALAVAATAPAGAAPKPPLSKSGRWMTDARGRVVVSHGVNMVYKRPPYVPAKTGFGADDARFLRRHGFNSVRLGTIYTAVEPQPGRYDDAYLEAVKASALVLARERIFTMVDFHQDLYNERYGGEGFPDWAVMDDGLPPDPRVGFPLTYVTSPGGNRAWQSLWDNRPGPGGVGLHERFAAAWGHVARAFRNTPYLMGYDLLNEPWAGPQWVTCANTEGCRAFEEGPLAALQAGAIAAIRSADPRNLVWYEPVVTTQFGTKYWIPNPTGDPRAGMSFHIYCLIGTAPGSGPGCEPLEQLSMDNAVARAEANGDTLLLSEWGATADLAVIHRQAERADRSMVSWQWWHYCACDDPTTAGPGDIQALVSDPARPPEGDNVFPEKLAAVVRPYPQVVAGTPRSWAFDRQTRTFTLRWSPNRSGGGAGFARGSRTEVFVPRLHYPDGYEVRATGARVVSPARSSLLVLRSTGESKELEVTVRPGRGTFPRVRPRGLTLLVSPGRDRRRPFRFTARGALRLPEGLEPRDGCRGRVAVRLSRGRRSLARRRAALGRDCRYRTRMTAAGAPGRLIATARFEGNELLSARRARSRRARVG